MVNPISKRTRELLRKDFWFSDDNGLLENQARLDRYFKLYQEKEQTLPDDDFDPTYRGLNAFALNTSYEDCFELLKWCRDHFVDSIMDVGCGLGRLSLLASYLFPEMDVLGVEYLNDRITLTSKALNRVSASKLFQADLLETWESEWREKELFFIYLPTGQLLRKVLFELSQKKESFYIAAIESHGQLINELTKDHSWIELYDKRSLRQRRHDPFLYFFKAMPLKIADQKKGGRDLDMLKDSDRLYYNSLACRQEIVSVSLLEGVERFFLSDDLHPIRYLSDELLLESFDQNCIVKTWHKFSILSKSDEDYEKLYHFLVAIRSGGRWRKVFRKNQLLWADDYRGQRTLLSSKK